MNLEVQFEDGLTPLMRRIIAEKPQWFGSSLKSAGYWSSQQLKAAIRSGAPGGKAYRHLMPAWMRRRLDAALGNEVRARYKALERMIRAVGYDKTRANVGVVVVGWLSASAVRIGTKQEKGFFTQVSEHMRKAFEIAEIPLAPGKNVISVPARETYGPMRPIIRKGAPAVVEKRIAGYLSGVTTRSAATTNRVYRVYK